MAIVRRLPRDQDLFEELARAPARAPIYVAAQSLLESEVRALEDLAVELATVVHDDHDGRAAP